MLQVLLDQQIILRLAVLLAVKDAIQMLFLLRTQQQHLTAVIRHHPNIHILRQVTTQQIAAQVDARVNIRHSHHADGQAFTRRLIFNAILPMQANRTAQHLLKPMLLQTFGLNTFA